MLPGEEHVVQLGDRGRLVLPAGIRREFKWKPGDRLLLEVLFGGSLRLVSARQPAQRLRGSLAHLGDPGGG
jgi:AbrB family looped-hinge helix DNA binding protein